MNDGCFVSPSGEVLNDLEEVFEDAFPEAYQRGMQRARLHEGQPWTCGGERGKTEIKGITFRDLRTDAPTSMLPVCWWGHQSGG